MSLKKYPCIDSAQTILLNCELHGIQNIVISPGSRNSPLAFGFASNPKFNCFSIIDERSAGFFALGISQQTKKPTLKTTPLNQVTQRSTRNARHS